MIPEHLTQLPEDVRTTLSKVEAQFAADDRRLEAAILAAARDSRLAARVPTLCDAVLAQHPLLSKRYIFRAVALSTGLHERHIARLFYRRG
jgi:hypothetical protein